MEWGGNYGAVEDIASAPYLILNGDERSQLSAAKQSYAEHLSNTAYIRLVERIGYAKRNVSPDDGQGLDAGRIEQLDDNW